MSRGQGNILTQQRFIPPVPPGPPFPLNSADNGLSVDPITGRIVLGQDIGAAGNPAQLLNDREIPMNGFFYNMLGGTIQEYIDDAFSFYAIANGLFHTKIEADLIQRTYGIGELNNRNNGTRMDIFDQLQQIDLRDTSEPYIQIRGGAAQRTLGISMQPTQIFLSALLERITASTDILGGGMTFEMDNINRTARIFENVTDDYLFIDLANGLYALGDYTNFVDPVIDMRGGANPYIAANINTGGFTEYAFFEIIQNPNPRYQLDLQGPSFRSRFFVFEDEFYWEQVGGPNGKFIYLQPSINRYAIGDNNGTNNGSVLVIDDTSSIFAFANTANTAALSINGVNGFTGTVANPVTITVDGGVVTNVA